MHAPFAPIATPGSNNIELQTQNFFSDGMCCFTLASNLIKLLEI